MPIDTSSIPLQPLDFKAAVLVERDRISVLFPYGQLDKGYSAFPGRLDGLLHQLAPYPLTPNSDKTRIPKVPQWASTTSALVANHIAPSDDLVATQHDELGISLFEVVKDEPSCVLQRRHKGARNWLSCATASTASRKLGICSSAIGRV
jgi:hypothetical protein